MSNVSMIDGHIDEQRFTDEQIVTLVNKNAKYSSQYKMIADLINHQKAEIERLQSTNNRLKEDIEHILDDRTNKIEKAKAEAIKEFAERLKKTMIATHKTVDGYYEYETEDYYIDNLVKEMVGE